MLTWNSHQAFIYQYIFATRTYTKP